MSSSLIELGSVELLELGRPPRRVPPRHPRYKPFHPARYAGPVVVEVRADQPPAAPVDATSQQALWSRIAGFQLSRMNEVLQAAGLTWAAPQFARRLQAAFTGQAGLLERATPAARAVVLLRQVNAGGDRRSDASRFRNVVARTLRLLPEDRRQAIIAAAEQELLDIAKEFAAQDVVAEKLRSTRLAAAAPGDFSPQDLTTWERLRIQGVVLGDLDAWEEYVNLSAELFFGDEFEDDGSLDGMELGKKKKKGLAKFFSKVGGVVKKVAKKIIPAAMTVVGAYTGNPQLISAGMQGLLARNKKAKEPVAVAAQGAYMLQNMGVELPANIQGFVAGANAALTPAEMAAARQQVLAASGNDPDVSKALESGTPTWVWVAAGGGGLAVLGTLVYLLASSGKKT